MKNTLKHDVFVSAATLIGTQLASLIKLNYIFGTYASFFSASQVTIPLAGAFGGPLAALITLLTRSLFHAHLLPTAAFFYYLPTFAAALYLQSEHKFIKSLAPVICMILFVSHPVGGMVPVYALYWLIPFWITITARTGIFARALSATFMAHAIGSVLFLYSNVTTPLLWQSLLGIVAVERIVFAAGISTLYLGIKGLAQLINAKKAPAKVTHLNG